MFGCALLVNETVKSYVWLLKTWLEAMLGRAPSTIITDDDKAMGKAITEVLPNTTHRLCLWHILQKVPEHLAHVYNKYLLFQKDFRCCIHDTLTTDEFELEWGELLVKYGLVENDWLNNLYMHRKKWVPAYFRTIFCTDMSTTQRRESMNKFFKDYVRSSTMVSDFVHQYEKTLNARYLNEKKKDVKTKTSQPILRTCHKIEEEARKVYTKKSFAMFQDELFNSPRYRASKEHEEGGRKVYWVAPIGGESRMYEVTLEIIDKKATCMCHMFEFINILCRHVLHVFGKKSLLDTLPEHYVLHRWTINAKNRIIEGIIVDEAPEEIQISASLMKNKMMMQFYEVAEVGSQSMEKYRHVSLSLQKLHQDLISMDNGFGKEAHLDDVGISNRPVLNCQVLSNFSFTLQDPPRVLPKGQPKSLRQKNLKENQVIRKRKYSNCKKVGYVKSTCPSHRDIQNITYAMSQDPVSSSVSLEP